MKTDEADDARKSEYVYQRRIEIALTRCDAPQYQGGDLADGEDPTSLQPTALHELSCAEPDRCGREDAADVRGARVFALSQQCLFGRREAHRRSRFNMC